MSFMIKYAAAETELAETMRTKSTERARHKTQKRAVGDILFVVAVALLHATLVRTHACARPWSLSKRQLALACSMFVSWFKSL